MLFCFSRKCTRSDLPERLGRANDILYLLLREVCVFLSSQVPSLRSSFIARREIHQTFWISRTFAWFLSLRFSIFLALSASHHRRTANRLAWALKA